jgi:hypothetical protein
MLQSSDPDPSMYGALPPGAWWEVANGAEPVMEPYADKAGDAAIVAARWGDLELRDVCFAYPVRKEVAGGWCGWGQGATAGLSATKQCPVWHGHAYCDRSPLVCGGPGCV